MIQIQTIIEIEHTDKLKIIGKKFNTKPIILFSLVNIVFQTNFVEKYFSSLRVIYLVVCVIDIFGHDHDHDHEKNV
jgi:hypothetical protein